RQPPHRGVPPGNHQSPPALGRGSGRRGHRRRPDPDRGGGRGPRGPDRRLPAGARASMTKRRRIAIVFGGRSAEHEVSVVSARSVLAALDPERYEVLMIGIDKQGRWRQLDALPAALGKGALPAVHDQEGRDVSLARQPGDSALVTDDGTRREIDVVFPILHGPFGEDGTIQGMLELAGVPYVGAGVLGSAVGMDKAMQTALF